jgi:hypothetical protein
MTDQEVSSLAEDMQTVFTVLGYGLADLLKECPPSERVPLLVANVKRRSLEHMSTEKLVPFYRALGNLIQELS